MSDEIRSPLHLNALSLNELTVGREIVMFNMRTGVLSTGTVCGVSSPHSDYTGCANIPIEYPTGMIAHVSTGDIGVAPVGANMHQREPDRIDEAGWNRTNFVVDAADRRLLPEPDPSFRRPTS